MKVVRPTRASDQGLLDQVFGLSIHAGGGIIHNQDTRVEQNGAGDRQPLFLPAGKGDPPLSDQSIVAVRQTHDKIMQPGDFGSCLYFFQAGIRFTVADILPDGSRKKKGILMDDADMPPQRCQS